MRDEENENENEEKERNAAVADVIRCEGLQPAPKYAVHIISIIE